MSDWNHARRLSSLGSALDPDSLTTQRLLRSAGRPRQSSNTVLWVAVPVAAMAALAIVPLTTPAPAAAYIAYDEPGTCVQVAWEPPECLVDAAL
jgi:hypothetical protein